MIITILAEPRTGSTNLAYWFRLNKEFTVLIEPYNPYAYDYKKEKKLNEWEYNTPHLLIKEIYTVLGDFNDLIVNSDKVIILHRENKKEQSESWIHANSTNNWSNSWRVNDMIKYNHNNIKIDYFNNLVDGFNSNYVSNENYFKISYEELYYNNGLRKMIDYLNLDCVKNENFPFGQRYRIDSAPNKLI
jgi:LPS sulfotransferase NodH